LEQNNITSGELIVVEEAKAQDDCLMPSLGCEMEGPVARAHKCT